MAPAGTAHNHPGTVVADYAATLGSSGSALARAVTSRPCDRPVINAAAVVAKCARRSSAGSR